MIGRRVLHSVLGVALLVGPVAMADRAAADTQPVLSITDTQVVEGAAGETTSAVFAIRISPVSENPTAVDYSTEANSARSPSDFSAVAGTVVVPPGTTQATLSVPVQGDGRVEGDERFFLRIGSSTGAANPDGYGEARIIEDDVAPYVSIADVTVTEGDAGTVDAVFPVTLSAAASTDVQVRYATATGSATSNVDYSATNGTLTIPAGATTATVTVAVLGDLVDESDYEDFSVGLSGPVGARLAPRSQGVGSIVDDDRTPGAAVTDVAVTEGAAGGTRMATFDVDLDRPSATTVVLGYRTGDNTALSGSDYVADSGLVVFAPGETKQRVKIKVVGDAIEEARDERFRLILSNVVGATLADAEAAGVIADDDDDGVAPPPTGTKPLLLSVRPTSVVEGQDGKVDAVFDVTLLPAATGTVTVGYGTAAGTATAATDFTTKAGTLTFAPGQTTRTVSVPVKGDQVVEADETFRLDLGATTGGATVLQASAAAVIRNDDFVPVLSVSPSIVTEGDEGQGDAPFVLSLSSPTSQPVTATLWVEGVDHPVSFAPYATKRTVHIDVPGDAVDENDQSLHGYLYAVSGARAFVGDTYAVVQDDDHDPYLTIDDVSMPEGDAGESSGTFTASLTAPSPHAVTVGYVTGTYSGGPVEGGDYVAATGTLTFAPGETQKEVTVRAIGDTLDEGDEVFSLYLTSPSGAALLDGTGTGWIRDDDALPQLSVDDAEAIEGDGGTTTITHTVVLEPPSTETVTVGYTVGSDGIPFAATAGTDYAASSGTLSFAPGQTSATVNVSVFGDVADETDERLVIRLISPTNATILDQYGDDRIVDDDSSSGLLVRDSYVYEGGGQARFVVYLAPASPVPVTVDYHTENGVAVAPSDFTAVSGTLTFDPGQTSKTVTVPVADDGGVEGDEYFRLKLDNAAGASIGDGTGYTGGFYTTVILNDDGPGAQLDQHRLSAHDTIVDEGDDGTADATVTVTLLPASSATVTVDYGMGTFTGPTGDDVDPQHGTLTFAPGETAKTVKVPVHGDRVVEATELFPVHLSNPYGAGIARVNGMVSIHDDDHNRIVSYVSSPVVYEGDDGEPTADFTVRISRPSLDPISLGWYTESNEAQAGEDFPETVGTMVFAPGDVEETVSIPVYGDTVPEGDERFNLRIDTNALVGLDFTQLRGIATIRDDDTSSLLGTVRDAKGKAQAGVTVTRSGGGLPDAAAVTAADGSFELLDVPNGRYALTASKSGRTFAPATMTVDVRSAPVPGLAFVMLQGQAISGRVVDGTGRPVPGVTMTRSGGGQPTVTATANGQGYYGFSQVPNGTYTITPARPGMTFTPPSRNVAVGPSATDVDFTRS